MFLKKIIISFDEYIQLKDIYQELVISPPLEEKPMAYLKNKSLVVEFPEKTVFDTTTYTLNFGNSIADNNEGNVLRGYEYVFSLKNYIDSMSVEGRVVNSFNYVPDKDRMFVMLYRNLNDSAPLKERPQYICRTNEAGYFSIHNIQTGKYRLFALKDANSNMKYDLQDEEIAFADSFIDLTPERFKDTVLIDDYHLLSNKSNIFSTAIDSTSRDTLQNRRNYIYYTEMGFFTKKLKNQYLTNNLRLLPEQLFFTFNQTLEDSLRLRPLNYKPHGKWYILDSNAENDTLKYWITDTSMVSRDSLKFELRYTSFDTTGNPKTSIDTLYLLKKPESQPKGIHSRKNRGKGSETDKETGKKNIKRLSLANNIKNTSAFDLNQNIVLNSSTPLFNFKAEKIRMFKIEDSIQTPISINITHDTNSMYKLNIQYKPEELMKYKIFIPDSTLMDIYGTTNDTIIIPFKTQSEDFYGTLVMKISNVKGPVILQLLDEKENLINEKYFNCDRTITYNYLYPHKYILKLIVDSNGNRKWDTGNYLQKLQPEKVIYYPQVINIRSNWEVDNNWDLNY